MTRDRGSATVWVVAVCALLLVVSTTVMLRTSAVLARHTAEAAADLAALAAAGQIGVGASPCAAARRIATGNGASLSSCVVALDPTARSGTVVVTVRLRAHLPIVGTQSVRATARAGRLPFGRPTGPG